MPSDLQVSNIKDLTGSNTGLSIASDGQVTIAQNNPSITLGSNAIFPTGSILQIKHYTRTTSYSDAFTSSWQNIPSYEVSITPKFTSSKILIIANLRAGNNAGSNHNNAEISIRRDINNAGYSEVGNSMQTNTKDDYGYAITHVLTHIDTPYTSGDTIYPVEYTVGYRDTTGSPLPNIYIGKIHSGEPIYESVIMAMEIAG
jgi:hypothetical protein